MFYAFAVVLLYCRFTYKLPYLRRRTFSFTYLFMIRISVLRCQKDARVPSTFTDGSIENIPINPLVMTLPEVNKMFALVV